jgi:hypothetical protein
MAVDAAVVVVMSVVAGRRLPKSMHAEVRQT